MPLPVIPRNRKWKSCHGLNVNSNGMSRGRTTKHYIKGKAVRVHVFTKNGATSTVSKQASADATDAKHTSADVNSCSPVASRNSKHNETPNQSSPHSPHSRKITTSLGDRNQLWLKVQKLQKLEVANGKLSGVSAGRRVNGSHAPNFVRPAWVKVGQRGP